MELTTNAIPRLAAEVSQEAQLQALNMSILTTRWKPTEVEAFAPLSGQDDLERFTYPISLYNRRGTRYLIVARALHDETNFHPLDIPGLRRHCGLKRTTGVISTICCNNTADQLQWVMMRCNQLQVEGLAIFTSPYHILRSLGTAIKAMETLGMPRIPILPISVGELDKPVPEMVRKGMPVTGADMVPNEIERFFRYSKARLDADGNIVPPDVASIEEIKSFLKWMRSEHPHLYQ